MATLVDTNVLLRLDQPEIAADLRRLRSEGEVLVLAPQCAVEAWVVATRPVERNGLGLSAEQASALMDVLERLFERVPEPPDAFETWRRVVSDLRIVGVRAHDARLAAFASAAGVDAILTLNPTDFEGPAAHLGLRIIHAGGAS